MTHNWRQDITEYAHVCLTCGVKVAVGMPRSMEGCEGTRAGVPYGIHFVATILKQAADDQLLGELSRRGSKFMAWSDVEKRISGVNQDYRDMRSERDKWKLRAEAAEGLLADIPRRTAEDAMRLREALHFGGEPVGNCNHGSLTSGPCAKCAADPESGAGIEAIRPDTSRWFDEVDLLADDE